MSAIAKLTLPVALELTVRQLAEAFCQLDDEAMAQFFIECADIASKWRIQDPRSLGAGWMWFVVGRHLRDCACSTYEVRDMVTEIASGMIEKEEQASE